MATAGPVLANAACGKAGVYNDGTTVRTKAGVSANMRKRLQHKLGYHGLGRQSGQPGRAEGGKAATDPVGTAPSPSPRNAVAGLVAGRGRRAEYGRTYSGYANNVRSF